MYINKNIKIVLNILKYRKYYGIHCDASASLSVIIESGLRYTRLPAIHVDSTSKSSLSITKSASAPKSSTPLDDSMPRACAGCSVAASSAWTTEQPEKTYLF